MTKITVNGREIEADPAKPLIAACHENGIDVPMYCYHPGLSPVGSCRICQVEVKQGELPARVVVACRTPVSEGMVVDTETERSHETRRQCLEFLLKNHPLDCPICDKAGECDLQDYAFAEGQAHSRSQDPRRKLDKRKSLGEVIVLDEERCILCSRCVRFMEEVPRTPQLTVAGLGSRSVISTFLDRPLRGNYQGNLADVCPVGALTLKDFRFQARVWNLRKTPSTCAECSRGCAVTVEVLRGRQVKRFRPRPDPVNQYWMCDTGRFALDPLEREGRLEAPALRGWRGLEPCAPEAALDELTGLLAAQEEPFVLASPFLTCEEGRELLELARELGVEACFLAPAPNDLADDVLHTGDPCPNRRGLTELGLAPLEVDEARERLAAAPAALLIGERIADLVGRDALAALPAGRRVVLADTRPAEGEALFALLPLPDHVERAGTWTNVDGVERRIAAARTPPGRARPATAWIAALRLRRGEGEARDLEQSGARS